MALKKWPLVGSFRPSCWVTMQRASLASGRSLAKLEHSQRRGVSAILFLAGTIKIVRLILIVLQAISYFICEVLKF